MIIKGTATGVVQKYILGKVYLEEKSFSEFGSRYRIRLSDIRTGKRPIDRRSVREKTWDVSWVRVRVSICRRTIGCAVFDKTEFKKILSAVKATSLS